MPACLTVHGRPQFAGLILGLPFGKKGDLKNDKPKDR